MTAGPRHALPSKKEEPFVKEKTQAALFIILSAFFFSMMQAMVRLSASGIGTMQQVFFRNSISLLVAAYLIKKNGLRFFGPKEYQPALLLRSLAGSLGMILLFYASAHASQGDVSVLSRTNILWVCLFAALILKERISKEEIPMIALCLAGTVIALRPTFDSSILPLLAAELSALCCGVAYVMISYCKGHVPSTTIVFYFSLFSTVGAGILMIPSWVSPTPKQWFMLILIGLFGSLGQICITNAYQKAPAAEVSIYDYSGIIFSALIGMLLLGEGLAVTTVIGALLITAAGLLSYFNGRRKAAS